MLTGVVAVHDVTDVEAFVVAMVNKARLSLTPGEREDLVAEGILILLRLAEQFKPRMAGYDKDGSFAGYCSIYLPKKISTAWHQWHPEHLLESTRTPDGRIVKRYRYGLAPASFNEHLERNPDLDSDRLRTPGNFVRSE